MIAPVLEELSKTLEDVVFLKVNFVFLSRFIWVYSWNCVQCTYTLMKGGCGRCGGGCSRVQDHCHAHLHLPEEKRTGVGGNQSFFYRQKHATPEKKIIQKFIFFNRFPQVAELKGANVEKLKELVESHRKPLSIQGEDF